MAYFNYTLNSNGYNLMSAQSTLKSLVTTLNNANSTGNGYLVTGLATPVIANNVTNINMSNVVNNNYTTNYTYNTTNNTYNTTTNVVNRYAGWYGWGWGGYWGGYRGWYW